MTKTSYSVALIRRESPNNFGMHINKSGDDSRTYEFVFDGFHGYLQVLEHRGYIALIDSQKSVEIASFPWYALGVDKCRVIRPISHAHLEQIRRIVSGFKDDEIRGGAHFCRKIISGESEKGLDSLLSLIPPTKNELDVSRLIL